MKRLFGLILVALSVAGCKSDAPVCDPFGGRTTIPPPSTGAVTGQPTDPCYQPPPLAPGPQPPAGCYPPSVQLPPATSTVPPAIQMPSQPSGATWTNPSAAPTALTGQPPQNSPRSTLSGSAPRPSSAGPAYTTAPPSSLAPRYSLPATVPAGNPGATPAPVATPPALPGSNSGGAPAGMQYSPPGGYEYRGASNAGAPAAQPTITNVGIARGAMVGDDRMPRPVDDTASAASAATRKPIISTLQPRGQEDASDRPIDIADLPRSP